MQTPSPSDIHLSEWQKNYFVLTSDTSTPEQKADACRAQIFRIQYACANSDISQVSAANLFKKYAEKYAAIMDSGNAETGLNNYAENVLARCQKNNSDQWQSALTSSNVMELKCVQKMVQASKHFQSSLTGQGSVNLGNEVGTSAFSKLAVCSGGDGEYNVGAGSSNCSNQGPDLLGRPLKYQNDMPSSSRPIDIRSFLSVPVSEMTDRGSCTIPLCEGSQSPFNDSLRPRNKFYFGQNASSSAQSAFPAGMSNLGKRKTFVSSGEISNIASDFVPNNIFTVSEKGKSLAGCVNNNNENRASGFKTARDQLWDTQQKQNQNQHQRTPLPVYSGTKKSLGAGRARGLFGKFVSPVSKQDGNTGMQCQTNGAGAVELACPTDERLKNIEPKMIELIMHEIMDHGPPVNWDDIAGVEFAKTTIKEIVVWPMLRPDIFSGLRGPPKGILLFGPPGTGKTLIGKCIACQSGATFFSIRASSLTSKWVGEGEKMVRALFAVARSQQPAVIFIDEIDSLLSQRGDGEHESSRRIKTEFLVELDGATTSSEDRILVIGATNRPQEIDEAARRRLVKRLYIPLPEAPARKQIVSRLMAKERHCLTEEELELIVKKSDGFSGADMTQLCREASLGPIRSLQSDDIATITPEQVRPIAFQDFDSALKVVRPSVSSKDLEVYDSWNRTFGSG